MKKNVGNLGRLVRFIIGAILIAVGVFTQNWIFGAVAIYPVLTAVFQRCPALDAMNFNPN